MLLRLIAAGTRMPNWVNEACEDYAGRLVGEYRLELKEVPLGQRGSGSPQQAIAKEGERMQAALPPKSFVVAFLIGGPDGIAPDLDAKADLRWSLSALTLPHGLARVMVAEALYRAVSIVKGHPYHRACWLAGQPACWPAGQKGSDTDS